VVAAVSGGMLTIEEVCRRYQISEEELLAWQRAFETYGIIGLRAGYAHQYRCSHPAAPQTTNEGTVGKERVQPPAPPGK
jgi:hypothetical protein